MRIPTPPPQLDVLSSRLDRRAVLKATATFAAMAAAGELIRTKAQTNDAASRAWDWHEATSIDTATIDSSRTTFEAEFAFTAVAPHWSGDATFPAAVELSLSDDGERFTEPVIIGPAEADAGPPDRQGRNFGDLMLTRSSRYVRYRAMDADGNPATIPDLTFTCIDATGGSVAAAYAPASFQATQNRPPIISREEWGAGLAYGGEDQGWSEWSPSYQTVRHVIIHHSETPSFRDPLVEIRSIHYYHAITRGWGDIGYNYLVDFMGNVYEGRVGGENAIGGHAYQYARGSAGICCMGDFELETATPEALAGLIWITAWAARYLDPLGRSDFHEVPNLPTICAHRDVWNSACPGDGLYADLDSVRSAVADVQAAGARYPDPTYVQGDIVEISVNEANLRSGPGTDFQVRVQLPIGTEMTILDGPTTASGYTWYRLRGAAGDGWAATSLFDRSDTEPVATFSRGDRVFINADRLNLRAEPTLRSSVRATMRGEATATVRNGPRAANGFTWYRIEGDYGDGWAAEQYLSTDQGGATSRFTVGDAAEVTTEGLNVRSAASGYASVVAQIALGTVVSVIGAPRFANGYNWVNIQGPDGSGWAADIYLRATSKTPSSSTRFGKGEVVVVDTDLLNLRSEPGTNSSVVTTLPNGTTGEVLDGPRNAGGFTWYRLSTEIGNGWAVETYLATSSQSDDLSIGETFEVNSDGLRLRQTPGTDGQILAVLSLGETGVVVDGPRSASGINWLGVETDKGTGWCAAYLLSRSASSRRPARNRAGDVVMVDTDSLRLRSQPSLSASVVTVLSFEQQGTVVGGPRSADGYDWLEIDTTTGRGWCVAYYLRRIGRGGPPIGTSVRVVGVELNLRAGPSTGRRIVAELPEGAVLEVLDGERGNDGNDWWRVSSSRYGTGWVVAAYLGPV